MESLEIILKRRRIENIVRAVILLMMVILISVLVIVSVNNNEPEDTVSEVSSEPIKYILTSNKGEPESSSSESTVESPKYTEDELFCMAAVIYNEAGGDACSDDTRRMVGYVVLNRVRDSRFPDTVREVLEAKRQYGRFWITGVKFAERSSLPQEQHAVDRAYRIAREVLETDVIPIPSTVVFQSEFQLGDSTYKYQDGMYFCQA